MPIDAIAASMAASAVLTMSREWIGTVVSNLPDTKVQACDDINPANVMQSCEPRSVGFFGRPRLTKYAGLCTCDDANVPQARSDEAAVRQLANPQSQIDIFLHKIDHSIGQRQPDVDLRLGSEELQNHRQDVKATKYDRGGHR